MDVRSVQTTNASMANGLHIVAGDMSDASSSPESTFDDTDLFNATITDDVTAQLAAAGPIGVAAAAAIATGRKRKRPHAFETNPSIRKRQQTRLFRKLKATIEEYTTRVGQQAVLLTCTPGKCLHSSQSFKVFGSQPLEMVVRNCKDRIVSQLEEAITAQMGQPAEKDPGLYELPQLAVDGIPTPVDKMTQAQLRNFIPEMLKYSTGRSKPGWGKVEYRPPWWPDDVPWANVRSDVRTEEQKKKVSWTQALRTIVKNCYRFHNREDLLPEFHDSHAFPSTTLMPTIQNPDGTLSIIHVEQPDGSVPQLVTLADGTQAQIIQTIPQNLTGSDGSAFTVSSQNSLSGMDISALQYSDGTQIAENHIVLQGEGGVQNTCVVSIPVSMYNSVVSNLGRNIQILHSSTMEQAEEEEEVALAFPKEELDDGTVSMVTIDETGGLVKTDHVHHGM